MDRKLGGAAEACWAHNPEVGGSKPLPATTVIALAIPFGISNTPNKTPYFVDKLKVKLVVTGYQIE